MFQLSFRFGLETLFLLSAAAALAQSGATNTYDINVINQVAVNSCSAASQSQLVKSCICPIR